MTIETIKITGEPSTNVDETNVNWFEDGEAATAETFNRPIKDVALKANEIIHDINSINDPTTIVDYVLDNPALYLEGATEYFGAAIAVNTNYIAISSTKDGPVFGDGVIYVYEINTRKLIAELQNPNISGTASSDGFGETLVMNETFLMISSRLETISGNIGAGVVYIYDMTTIDTIFTPIYNLLNPSVNNKINNYFGTSMAMNDTRLLVGAPNAYNDSAVETGRVWCYDITNFGTSIDPIYIVENPNLHATNSNDRFGASVAMANGYFVVGAPDDNYIDGGGEGDSRGVVYLFNLTTGIHEGAAHNLFEPVSGNNNEFGYRVSMSDGYILVSSKLTAQTGQVYLFTRGGYNHVHTFVNPNPGDPQLDNFGNEIILTNTHAIINAVFTEIGAEASAGITYIYNAINLADITPNVDLITTIENPNAYGDIANDGFGGSIAMSNDHLVIGAKYEEDELFSNRGKVYVFKTSKAVTNNQGLYLNGVKKVEVNNNGLKVIDENNDKFDVLESRMLSDSFVLSDSTKVASSNAVRLLNDDLNNKLNFHNHIVDFNETKTSENWFDLYPELNANGVTLRSATPIGYGDVTLSLYITGVVVTGDYQMDVYKDGQFFISISGTGQLTSASFDTIISINEAERISIKVVTGTLDYFGIWSSSNINNYYVV